MQDKAEDEGNTVCIDKDDNEILREFNRRQYVTFRCYRLLASINGLLTGYRPENLVRLATSILAVAEPQPPVSDRELKYL